MVFLSPILGAFNHVFPHQGFLRSRLVAAAGAVGIFAVGGLAVEVVGVDALEVAVLDVERMVVHHVENHSYASLVQCLHHLLELLDSCGREIGVGGIAALGYIVVLRVVAPVVLRHVEACLVNRGIVERRQDVYGVHAERLQIFCRLGLRERKEFALVLQAR